MACSPIDGVFTLTGWSVSDERGNLSRIFCRQEMAAVIEDRQIVQVNQSKTRSKGAVRGFHFQNPPYAEMKLIRCIKGAVWDVAIDLRQGSSTFLHWFAQELTPENGKMMVIPEGCAHGFQALAADSELLYLHTAYYTPSAEAGVNVLENKLGVMWPLPIEDLSQRDSQHPWLSDDFKGIVL
jgi:dTDP-4-dehydrorhamnose 3,5-epimerase